jgi:hypothetical protein
MAAAWIGQMCERFGELLVKEFGRRGFVRPDAVPEVRNVPIERHGGWEWTFWRMDGPLNRYITIRLVFVGPPPDDAAAALMKLIVTVSADNDERFGRRELGEVEVVEPSLRRWTQELWALLTRAPDAALELSAADLSQDYVRRPGS